MVEHVGCAVESANVREWLVLIVQLPPHRPTQHQAPGGTDRAERIEAVCILNDHRLYCARRDPGGEAVGLDGVPDARRQFVGVAGTVQEVAGRLGGEREAVLRSRDSLAITTQS